MDIPQPLSARVKPPAVVRLNRKLLLTSGFVLASLAAWLIMRSMEPTKPKLTKEEVKVEGRAAPMPDFLKQSLPLMSTSQAQAALPPQPPAEPTQRISEPSRPQQVMVPQPPPLPPIPPIKTQGNQNTKKAPSQVTQQPAPQKPAPSRWLFQDNKSLIAAPPFSEETPKTTASKSQQSSLIAQASWARCAEPTKCLYETQLIHGQIIQAVNSDIPGAIWIEVTNEVTDMFGQGVPLLPQKTKLIGAQQGAPKTGQARLDFLVQRAILPNGTVLALNSARLGDMTGAAGIAGDVNNHYGKIGIAAILSAALNIGVRSQTFSNNTFRATPEEEFGRDVAGSLNSTGQEIIRRQLIQGPTITLKQGEPVIVQLKETVSLQTPPTVVRY